LLHCRLQLGVHAEFWHPALGTGAAVMEGMYSDLPDIASEARWYNGGGGSAGGVLRPHAEGGSGKNVEHLKPASSTGNSGKDNDFKRTRIIPCGTFAGRVCNASR
jgi:hypothetical protein